MLYARARARACVCVYGLTSAFEYLDQMYTNKDLETVIPLERSSMMIVQSVTGRYNGKEFFLPQAK
jgi:hypothetical protein